MPTVRNAIKANHKAIKRYYDRLAEFKKQGVKHEGAVSKAFEGLLNDTARSRKWTLIPLLSEHIPGSVIVPDGTLRDDFYIPRGYWEAKDTDDNLEVEVRKKIAKGYPTTNIIFEDTRQAILYQDKQEAFRASLSNASQLADLLNLFYSHAEPEIDEFEKAVEAFKERVPDLALGLAKKIQEAHKSNKSFAKAFGEFFDLCKASLNPNMSEAAVDEMLVQHLLTERLIRTIFDNEEFTKRNVIAAEVEKVIEALVSKSFNRKEFLKSLDRFYVAIEQAARTLTHFSEKQHFLNTVYERFFQGYSVKVADTHGIVYTPQSIVDFMCASVEEVLKQEFGLALSSKGVNILDPCTGTGNFIVNLIRRMPKRDLPRMYREQLFANEVMLMPYYIAALNIEHAFYKISGEYESFEGLCFVDTLDMAEHEQGSFGFMTEKNTTRVRRQKSTPITVIIGNPPYNVGQLNENDNNKNRKYKVIDERIKNTYSKDSKASNKNKLSDVYVRFFRWAVDRLEGRDGIVCFVSNNSFVDQTTFDGMRKHLMRDFTRIFHLDLHGNVRKNPKLSGTTHNVFGIQVGVGITLAIKRQTHKGTSVRYHRVDEFWKKEEKFAMLRDSVSCDGVRWRILKPDSDNNWLIGSESKAFGQFAPMANKTSKGTKSGKVETLFKLFSLGVATARDTTVYDFDKEILEPRVKELVEAYNLEVARYIDNLRPKDVDQFVCYDKIKWSENLKKNLIRGTKATFSESKIRTSLYRPFTKKSLFFDPILNARRYQMHHLFPVEEKPSRNAAICVSGIGRAKPSQALVANAIPCLDLLEKTQCFPFFSYNEDGNNERENITDWALEQFRVQYKDKKIGKWDIFYYVYGILHHPGYRTKYADNLKKELPRVPYAPDFWVFSKTGKELTKWHLEYEKIEPFELKYVETPDLPLSYRVEDKMRLAKDKRSIIVNPSLTLCRIPAECFEYRLGNRSALDWVIDQYQVSEDKRSGIRSDPNREDDPEYIVRLVGQVIRVSLETVKLVKGLPKQFEG